MVHARCLVSARSPSTPQGTHCVPGAIPSPSPQTARMEASILNSPMATRVRPRHDLLDSLQVLVDALPEGLLKRRLAAMIQAKALRHSLVITADEVDLEVVSGRRGSCRLEVQVAAGRCAAPEHVAAVLQPLLPPHPRAPSSLRPPITASLR